MAAQVEDIKWLPSHTDRRFMVDGFAFKSSSCSTYFLTHFHSDHTIGLTRNFSYGHVYTSEVTARLLAHDMGLAPHCIRVLPLHVPHLMHGCRITLLDANHCPGAVMLLIEVLEDAQGQALPSTHTILHMGDCRWAGPDAHQLPAGIKVDTLFMDTTYAKPQHTFPPQSVVVDALVLELRALLAAEPHTLIVVAAYHIGKERVYLALAKRLGIKVWCSAAKRRVLHMLDLPQEDLDLLTDEPQEAGLHVSGWGMRPDQLQARFLRTAQEAGLKVDLATDMGWTASLARKGQHAQHTQQGAGGVGGTGSGGGKQEASTSTGCQGQQDGQQQQGRTPHGAPSSEPASCVQPGVKQEQAGPGQQQDDAVPWLEGGAPEDGQLGGEEEAEEAGAAAAVQDRWKKIVGIKATGWSFRKKGGLLSKWTVGPVTVVGAPYSEHSSWEELCACVRTLRPSRIIPTAYSASTPGGAKAIVERFVHLMDLSRQKGRMDMYLRRGSSLPALTHSPSVPRTTTATNNTPISGVGPVKASAAASIVPQGAGAVKQEATQYQRSIELIDLLDDDDDGDDDGDEEEEGPGQQEQQQRVVALQGAHAASDTPGAELHKSASAPAGGSGAGLLAGLPSTVGQGARGSCERLNSCEVEEAPLGGTGEAGLQAVAGATGGDDAEMEEEEEEDAQVAAKLFGTPSCYCFSKPTFADPDSNGKDEGIEDQNAVQGVQGVVAGGSDGGGGGGAQQGRQEAVQEVDVDQVDVREQARIWGMIQAEQQQRANGHAAVQSKQAKGAGSSKAGVSSQGKRKGGGQQQSGGGSQSQQGGTPGSGSGSKGSVRKRSRVKGPTGTAQDPVLLDVVDVGAGGEAGARAVSGKQSSIRSFFTGSKHTSQGPGS